MDLRKYDEEIAYLIYLIEHEFNVGPVTEDFPLLKFWNLCDKANNERFKKSIEESCGANNDGIKTFR